MMPLPELGKSRLGFLVKVLKGQLNTKTQKQVQTIANLACLGRSAYAASGLIIKGTASLSFRHSQFVSQTKNTSIVLQKIIENCFEVKVKNFF